MAASASPREGREGPLSPAIREGPLSSPTPRLRSSRRRLLTTTLSLLALSVLCLSLLPVVAAGEPQAVSSEGGAAEDVPEPAPAAVAPEPEPVKMAPAGVEEGTEAPAADLPTAADLPQSSEGGVDVAMISGVIATVLIGLIGACYLFGGEKKRVFKGDAVFLLGECDSGKTALVFHLRDNIKGDAIPRTQTSMQYNETQVELRGDEAEGKVVRVIDFPGHPRLRPVLFDIIEDCAAVVFVIDSCTFANQAKEIASFMLDLLTSTSMLKHCTSLLVMCNKTDALPDDMAGVSPKIKIKQRLEKEIESLRKTRAESLDDIGNTLRVELEIAGDVFKWSDAPVEVEFTDASVKLAETQAVTSFLAKL